MAKYTVRTAGQADRVFQADNGTEALAIARHWVSEVHGDVAAKGMVPAQVSRGDVYAEDAEMDWCHIQVPVEPKTITLPASGAALAAEMEHILRKGYIDQAEKIELLRRIDEARAAGRVAWKELP